MIRPKLILAFGAMALLTAFCGAVGMFFIERIDRSVSQFSNVTVPLLTESMALVDNAQRMRATFLSGINGAESLDDAAGKLKALHEKGQEHLGKLSELAAGQGLNLSSVEESGRRFAAVIGDMIEAHRRDVAATALTKERLDRFAERRSEVEARLIALVNRSEGEINRREDEAKVQVQTGTATVDSLGNALSDLLNEVFPVVQHANRLLTENRQIADAMERLLPESESALTAHERRVRAAFKTIGSVTRKLAGRLRDDQGRAELDRIREGIAGIESAVLGPEGLFAGQREMLTARSAVVLGRATLDAIEARYLGGLDRIVKTVSSLNQQARTDAAGDIDDARIIIGFSVLLALVAGLGLGLFFARRLSAPAMRLADHAEAIGAGGDLAPLPDAAINERADELGKLARAFNHMIVELAGARQRLIDWSEAEIRTQFERLNAAINNMPQGLAMFDAQQKLIVCNKRYSEIYALDPEYAKAGTPLRTLIEDHIVKGTGPVGDENGYVETRLQAIEKNKPYYYVNEVRDGRVIAISSQPMANGGSVTTHEDITERRRVEAKIAYMAHHDALTDLPNRLSLREQMEKTLAQVDRGAKIAVMCLDLDHFKSVNDTLGHPVGDALLQAVAERIRACVRPNDIVARLGGDEFAVIQVASEQPVGSTALAARLIKELSEPYDVRGHQTVIGASVGIAIAPDDGTDADGLMKNADMALYRAKEDGRGVYRFFETEMDARMQRRRRLELDLRRAAQVGEFELFYQPTVQVDTGQVTSLEALLRWHHPQRGLVLPDEFVPLAEEIGLINPIGAWVLKQACRDAMTWPGELTVAVNLSPVQFKSGTLVLDVIAALGASGLAARRLELEITESVLLQDTDATIDTLNQLRELGVRIAMDDFGTGYSSLGYLRKFPFDKIKIDRSFIRDLAEKPDSIAIVRAVTGLGSSLGMSTTAEGVETAEQLRQLREEGCTDVQGFLFSEARPARELPAMLERLRHPAKAVA